MKKSTLKPVVAFLGLAPFATPLAGSAQNPGETCVPVKTRSFPTEPRNECVGEPAELCTEGVIVSGILKGTFVFQAEELVPGAGLQNPVIPDLLSFSYTQTFKTRRGNLVVRGYGIGAVSQGLFTSIHSLDSGTGRFAQATRASFANVSSTDPENPNGRYEGEVCFHENALTEDSGENP